jgi:molybdate transport system ATP-binding protein
MTLAVSLKHAFPGFSLDIQFDAPPGITVLFGRSGSGKTTIINAVAGLLKPDAGKIRVGEQVLLDTDARISLPPHRRQLGTVFQEGRLFPYLTVKQNLGYGRWFAARRNAKAISGKAASMDEAGIVEMLGIDHLLDRRPTSLSGGEKQRVAIGRALLANPGVILADEPLASLDEARKAEILPFFERLRDEVSVPILYVTHAPAEVARLATTVVALDDGRVARQGSAIDVLGDPMVMPAGVRGAGALLEARVVAHHDDGLSELSAGGISLFLPRVAHPVGSSLRVRIAAQEVLIARDEPARLSALNILPGTIEAIRAGEGPGAIVSIRTPAGLVLARVTRRSAQALGLEEGVSCHAIVKAVAVAPQDVGGAG